MLLLLLLQAAASQPDIELTLHARAKEVTIEQGGETRLEVRAEPDAGSRVETNVRPRAEGRAKLPNVTVDIHARTSVADPSQNRTTAETTPPQ